MDVEEVDTRTLAISEEVERVQRDLSEEPALVFLAVLYPDGFLSMGTCIAGQCADPDKLNQEFMYELKDVIVEMAAQGGPITLRSDEADRD